MVLQRGRGALSECARVHDDDMTTIAIAPPIEISF